VRIYVATTNAGKLRELRVICAQYGWQADAFPGYRDPVEGETSYADNAARKARALAEQLREANVDGASLGDDSGIEVFALGGRPGVLSARYGGDATWPQRRALLLAELAAAGAVDRSARFVCAVHLVAPDGREYATQATINGTIVTEERGEAGFSYDPLFYYPPFARTFGESSEEEKNEISHRARAIRALAALHGM
jgi:XTP/dITP diphosphohydrolase